MAEHAPPPSGSAQNSGQRTRLSRRAFLRAGGVAALSLGYAGGAHVLLRDDRWEPNDSYWVRSAAARPFPSLSGQRTFDVAVVGGGLTGVSAAYHIRTSFPDARVALLEARRLGFGASGRNGGYLVDYTTNFERLPGTEDNVEFVKSLVAEQRLACDLVGDFVNPYKLVLGLGELCDRAGVEVFERTHVREVRPAATIGLAGDGFRAEAGTVVLATNAYTPRLGFFRRELLPLHHGCILTKPLGGVFDTLPSEYTESIRGGSDYYWTRTLPDRRLLLGGGLRYSYDNGLSFRGAAHLHAALIRAMRRIFPQVADARIEHRWTGPMGFFADGNPRLGTLGEHANIYFGLGYAGMGVTMSVRFGHFMSQMLDGQQPPAWTMRPACWLPGEPFRYMLANATAHLVDLGVLSV